VIALAKAIALAVSLAHAAPTPVMHAAVDVYAACSDLDSDDPICDDYQREETPMVRADVHTPAQGRAYVQSVATVTVTSADDDSLGCGTCEDNHDGSCTCPPVACGEY
jgi:hypothetical protein